MAINSRSFNHDSDTLLSLAAAHGFLCTQDDTGRWRIEPPPSGPIVPDQRQQLARNKQQDSDNRWSLQQEGDRWLLSISDVPQIWFRVSEAIAFIMRWQSATQ